MRLYIEPFTVHKRFALTISRGTTASSTNLRVMLDSDGIEGWGEATPFSVGDRTQTSGLLHQALSDIAPALRGISAWDRAAIARLIAPLPSAARAAIDMALYDWMGKRLGLPLWKLWGLDRTLIPGTSVTIGISSPEAAQVRLRDWLTLPVRRIKIKLGSPEGVGADRAMFEAVQSAAPMDAEFFVDANGGWTLDKALEMSHWLADRQVVYLEQPLASDQDADLLNLKTQSPLPIFVDESCWTSRDVARLAHRVDGINIKLMKSGGLTEALAMIHTARACGLQIMLGCYSDSALSNTAAAHLAPLVDHLDLDSHLNLRDDPFVGAILEGDRLVPNEFPGLGVILRS
jgi:L-Ala-D/L-Glu epimerase